MNQKKKKKVVVKIKETNSDTENKLIVARWEAGEGKGIMNRSC